MELQMTSVTHSNRELTLLNYERYASHLGHASSVCEFLDSRTDAYVGALTRQITSNKNNQIPRVVNLSGFAIYPY